MTLQISEVKKKLQDHLQDGLLVVVGSGLSIAEGISGMDKLAQHLKENIPRRLKEIDPGWTQMVINLDAGKDLEISLADTSLCPSTVDAIIQETANLIFYEEEIVFKKVIADGYVLPFTLFIKHLFKAGKKFHLITPNYDRLIELATEVADIGVDSRFWGYNYGKVNPKRSADSHRESYIIGKSNSFRSLPCLNIYKPHGSLDWYEVDGKIVRSPMRMDKPPVIITPGLSKYRESFRSAFDDQRVAGNRSVVNARRFLYIGYGFNDDHLEQYLCPGLRLNKPTVIITKDLSENAKKVIQNSPDCEIIVLTASPNNPLFTLITNSAGEELTVNEQLWNLNGFIKGVI